MRGTHQERGRAEGFGALAAAYDQLRPSYPIALIHWLSQHGTGTAVDVGCGTGRVASLLADSGWSVIGVEPDARMAAIAREHGIRVVVASFEQCGLPDGSYDLVCAGTAWHWIDPAISYDIAARLLRHGGQLAVFRNSYIYDPDIAKGIVTALDRHAPNLLHDCIPLGTASKPLVDLHAQEMSARSDLFTEFDLQTFTHERLVAAQDWIKELETHSPVATLDQVTRTRLLGELAQYAAASSGNQLRIRHETPCVAVKRR
ncbi:class I SAM-dependent methyltransferase [Petrachloros mirabilis]